MRKKKTKPKPINTRQRMRISNGHARKWMLDNGYTWIWFKPHGKRKDWVFTPDGNYYWLDLWGLFDGLALKNTHTIDGSDWFKIIPFQVKTNAWAKEEPIVKWLDGKDIDHILVVNVKGVKGKWKVVTRKYSYSYGELQRE